MSRHRLIFRKQRLQRGRLKNKGLKEKIPDPADEKYIRRVRFMYLKQIYKRGFLILSKVLYFIMQLKKKIQKHKKRIEDRK